jgi:hypothetical protein
LGSSFQFSFVIRVQRKVAQALTPRSFNSLFVPAAGHIQVSAKVSRSAANNSSCHRASARRTGNHSAARRTGDAPFCIVSETSSEAKKDRYKKNGSEVHLTILWSVLVGNLFEGAN